MKKKTAMTDVLYFEDLPKYVQEILIDLLVSAIENRSASDHLNQDCRRRSLAISE